MNRASLSPLALIAVIGLVLPACSAGGASEDDGIEHPTASDEPILVVSNAGGFVPPQFMATQLPPFVLLGDGRVIVQGAQTLIFPGPLLPPLMERRLSEAGIQQVLEAVGETGLFDEDLRIDGAQAMVADAADTVFTVNADGREVTVSIYALGTFSVDGVATPPDMDITEAEVEADRTLMQLYDRLLGLDAWLGEDAWTDEEWQPYQASAYRLYVRDNTEEQVDGGGVPPTLMEWPEASADPTAFGEEQATFGDGTRCGVVQGDEAEAWSEQLAAATQLTFWTDAEGEQRYQVGARPLLPHDEAVCPELIGA